MKVRLSLYFPFREEIPENPVELELPEGAVVGQAVEALVSRYPSLRPRFSMRKAKSTATFPPL